jgi:hypothetical protein
MIEIMDSHSNHRHNKSETTQMIQRLTGNRKNPLRMRHMEYMSPLTMPYLESQPKLLIINPNTQIRAKKCEIKLCPPNESATHNQSRESVIL